MRHGFLVVLLGIAGALSIAVGVHRLQWRHSQREAFERHVAELCVQAAERTCAKCAPNAAH
jgi:hypothetical protein